MVNTLEFIGQKLEEINTVNEREFPIGSIINTLKCDWRNWLPADSRSLKIEQYPELFKIIGYMYGGEGEFFNLPDCGSGFSNSIHYPFIRCK